MAFETLPPDYQAFFDTGELPASMQGEAEAVAAEAARIAAEQAANDEAARIAATPPVVLPVAKVEAPLIDPAPQPPENNPYLERLLAENDTRQQALQKQLAEAQEQLKKLTEVAPPDPMTDPLGFLAHKIDATQKEIAALRESQSKQTAEQAQQTELNTFLANVNSKVQEFTATHPDYNDAYKHLATMRMQDFKDVGMTDAQAKQAFGQEEIGITQRALQMGKNPAEVAYGMATRYGYKPGAPPAGTTAAVVKAEDKLDTIKKGLEAAKDATRGVPPAGVADPANLRNMSDKDLNKLVEDDWDAVFGKRKGIFG